jgi:hypothetical protein
MMLFILFSQYLKGVTVRLPGLKIGHGGRCAHHITSPAIFLRPCLHIWGQPGAAGLLYDLSITDEFSESHTL